MGNESDFLLGTESSSSGKQNNGNTNNITRSIYTAYVISVEDNADGCRIKAKIPQFDRQISNDSDKLYAYPFSPINNNIIPKVGEAVWIILGDLSTPYSYRFYSGPIIPQYQNINNSPFETALSLTNEATTAPLKAIRTIEDTEGLYPIDKETKHGINTIGRDNTDIIQRKNELLIRTGKHLTDKNTLKNNNNPVYSKYRLSLDDKTSSILHVADRHLFVSHKSGKSLPSKIMSDEELDSLFNSNDSFGLLKAEPTIKLLKLLVKVIATHSHEYHNLSTSQSDTLDALLNYDFNSIFSTNHKIV